MTFPWPLNYVYGRSREQREGSPSSAALNDDISMNVDMEHGEDSTMHFSLRSVLQRIMDSISLLPDLLQLFVITIVFVTSLYLYDRPSLHVHSISSLNFVVFRVLAFFGILFALYLFAKLLPMSAAASVKSSSNPMATQTDQTMISTSSMDNQHLYPPSSWHTAYYNQHKMLAPSSLKITQSAPPVLVSAPLQPSFAPSPVRQHRLQLPVLSAPSPVSATSVSFNIGKLEMDAEDENEEHDREAEEKASQALSPTKANDHQCVNGTMVKIELASDANDANQHQVQMASRMSPVVGSAPKWTRRQTSNKQRAVVMLKKRKASDAYRTWLKNMRAKKKNDRNKQRSPASRKRTRVDTNNETKKKIVQCYLRRKKRDKRFSARACKQHLETTERIKCGRENNINRWSKELNVIEYNIKVYGARKYRNRPSKGWFSGMEEKLKRLIERRRPSKVNDEWIRAKALEIQKQMYPKRAFKASQGW
eukprot:CAMPEP_0202697976 /NCGR_PEP_ID=MMETSP1385-20130828/11263_1 /ASSEMBLY_ACC=CAM_ASM_000861 /TAXON_ID=933848 /ORGANISM="Elphidium margaritaceum" /LENGTH=477 /DNA_ID=CAMNT_0049354569 /DNA_START=66 /DNA_END=1496 /DNA_ORIENTATION=+